MNEIHHEKLKKIFKLKIDINQRNRTFDRKLLRKSNTDN